MSDNFVFQPDTTIPSAQYEFVNMIKNAPKNPKDFHDLENMLRYKMVAFFKEIIGNCRTSSTNFNTEVAGPFEKYIRANGIWYIDGYRLSMSNVVSETTATSGDDYQIWVALKFDEVDYSEHAVDFPSDPIALQDARTKQFIPTSTRIKLSPKILISVFTEDEPSLPTGYTYKYRIGKATWNAISSTWDYIDDGDFVHINTKYNEAISIVQSALHLESDAKTAIIERIVTGAEDESGLKAYAYMEEVNSNKVRMGFANEQGTTFAAFEMIYQDGDWQPILWMKNGTAEYPVSFMTPSGFEVFDNKGNSNDIKSSSINLGNDINKFIVDTTELIMLFNKIQVGLWVKNGLLGYELKNAVPTQVAPYTSAVPRDSITYNKGAVLQSDINNSGNPKIAIYRFNLDSNIASTNVDGLVRVRHMLAYDTPDLGSCLITAKVEGSDSAESGYTTILQEKYLLTSGSYTIGGGSSSLTSTGILNTTPMEFSIRKTVDSNVYSVYQYIQITYSIEPFSQSTADVVGSVAMHAGLALSWVYYSAIYPAVQVPNLVIGNTAPNFSSSSYHIFWIDEDGNARIKKVDNNTQAVLGQALDDLANSAAGTSITDTGGKIIGDSSLVDADSTVINNTSGYLKPTYDSSTKKLGFPVVAINNNLQGGLISSTQYADIMSRLDESAPITGGTYTSSNVAYVSPAWQNKPAAGTPFFETIQAAVNYLYAAGGQLSGLVLVYPGQYSGDLTLVQNDIDTNPISIVALDPKNTAILGKLTCDNSTRYRRAYIDIPITQSGSANAVSIVNASSQIIFGKNATITSTSLVTPIKIDQGVVDIYSEIWHTVALGTSPTLDIGSGANGPTVNIYGNINNFSYSSTAGNLGGSITLRRGMVHVYGIIRNDAIETSTSQFLVSITGEGTCVFNAHNDIVASKGMGILKSNVSGGSSVSYLYGKLFKNDALTGVNSNAILVTDGTVNIYSPYAEITGTTSGHFVRNYNTCNIHNSYITRTGALPLFKTTSNYLNLYNCVLKNGTGTGNIIENDTTGGFTAINCVTNCGATAYTGIKLEDLNEIISI